MAAAQLAYFLKAQLVHSIIGSAKLLAFCEQVIVDFDMKTEKFSFIDKEDMNTMCDWAHFLENAGGLYSQQATGKLEDLITSSKPGNLSFMLKEESALVLNVDRKLSVLSGDKLNVNEQQVGLLFTDDLYYCMSQGLINPQLLELVDARNQTV